MTKIKDREAAGAVSAVGGQGHRCGVIVGGNVTAKGANVSRREDNAVPSATVGMLVVKITKNSLL